MSLGLTNLELLEYLELPSSIVASLQTEQGQTFTATANEFLNALFNKVIYQQVDKMDFTNPFKKYDGTPVRYGSTIENVFVETPRGYKYDRNATDPFERKNPEVKALYASINYEMQYETTIYDADLRRAVLSEYGFMNMIDTILASLSTAKTVDEYRATLAMLNNANIMANGIEEVEKGINDKETAEIVTKKIIDVMSSYKFPSTFNNKLGVLNVTPQERCLLIIRQDVLNTINLDYLAGVYNLNKVDLIKNIIPVDTFMVSMDDPGGEGIIDIGEDISFMLIDEKGFDNHVALEDGGLIYNPKGKYTNHFYNLWKIISYKYFYNARAFKLVDSIGA